MAREAPFELSTAQQADTGGWTTMGSHFQGVVGPHLRRRGLSLVVHGQTIGLSISDAAEIHFEELQLGKTINHTEEFCVD